MRVVNDEDRKFNPTFEESVTKSIDADMVIMAIGQSPDLSLLEPDNPVNITKEGLIQINEPMVTIVPRIFAGGEVTDNPLSVVEAIKMGKTAAQPINQY